MSRKWQSQFDQLRWQIKCGRRDNDGTGVSNILIHGKSYAPYRGDKQLLQNQIDKADVALGNREHSLQDPFAAKIFKGRRWSEVYPRLNYSKAYIGRRKTIGRSI